MSEPPAAPRRAPGAAWRLALAAALLFAASGGGRIVGSDEVTMLEVSRAMLHGHLDVPEGATLAGRDGRFYSKNAAGQAVLALPLTALAELGTHALPPARRELATRAVFSFFNAVIGALVLAACFATSRFLGASGGAAFAGALLLGFTTPFWVYAKSFMAEPLEALGLLLALGWSARARAGEPHAERIAAVGLVLAVASKLSVLPLAIACLAPLLGAPRAAWRWPLAGIAVALALHGLYDFARFGTPLETGYGAQASPAAFTTPLWVGLYGLVFSSGKGVLWFAPALWLVFSGVRAMTRRAPDPPDRPLAAARAVAAAGALLAIGLALVLYGRFQHWAGDGSFGPRYLVPVLPLAFLPVTFALNNPGDRRTRRDARIAAWVLGVLGFAVTLGGVGIYFGAEMREAGDYPYTLPLDDPHFMESSHFNPRFSPILGHWSMLRRNVALHLAGRAPRLLANSDAAGSGRSDTRIGLDAANQSRLLFGLDFWWCYAAYAGLPAVPLALAALVLFALGLAMLRSTWRAATSGAG